MELYSALLHEQRQRQVFSAVQQQSLKILQMPVSELWEQMQRAYEENPLLEWEENGSGDTDENTKPGTADISEEAEPDDRDQERAAAIGPLTVVDMGARINASLPGKNGPEENAVSRGDTFRELLLEQLPDLHASKGLEGICRYLIESLDSRGYLDGDIPAVASALRTSQAAVAHALKLVQRMQPRGVGARCLQECLLLQLEPFPQEAPALTFLIQNCLPLLACNKLKEIAGLLNTDVKIAEHYCGIIRSLEPIPSRGYDTGEPIGYIVPEASVMNEGGRLSVWMNHGFLPPLRMCASYGGEWRSQMDGPEKKYLMQKQSEAAAFLRDVRMRNTTVARVIEAVVDLQPDYFLHGKLKPMRIADVAQRLGIHESTASRAVQGKYVVCRYGTVLLKSLFSSAVACDGKDALASAQVRQRIQKLIELEDKKSPLSDFEICAALKKEKLLLSRRTVAKYRSEMGILPCSRRRRYG